MQAQLHAKIIEICFDYSYYESFGFSDKCFKQSVDNVLSDSVPTSCIGTPNCEEQTTTTTTPPEVGTLKYKQQTTIEGSYNNLKLAAHSHRQYYLQQT